MPRALPRSKRQYVQNLNTPVKEVLASLKMAKGTSMPPYIEPLLPTLRERPPSGDDWVHEVKFDGYRFQLHIRQGQTQLFTRRGHDWTHKARNIAATAFHLRTHSAIIDGEIAVMAPDGTTDFNELERELERELGKEQPARLTLYAFDVLYLNGFDLRHETLTNRKRALRTLLQDLPKDSPIQYSEHLEGDALRMKQEALVAQSSLSNLWPTHLDRLNESALGLSGGTFVRSQFRRSRYGGAPASRQDEPTRETKEARGTAAK